MHDLSRPPADSASRTLLTRALKFIIVAAVLTAPLYLIGERFNPAQLGRVLLINGGTATGAGAFLLLVKRGHARLISEVTVWSLLALISYLAATGGEPIDVNVINFVLVLVLASMLTPGTSTVLVAVVSIVVMSMIAYTQSGMAAGAEGGESFVEALAQFVPKFILIAVLLSTAWRKGPRP